MNKLRLTKKDFPGQTNGAVDVPVSRSALVRAAIAAGSRPDVQPATIAGRAQIGLRVSAVKSAVDFSRKRLRATKEFLRDGSTNKGHASYFVGNAFCAHTAMTQLQVPWLLDVETLSKKYRVEWAAGDKRPDYLGLDVRRQWHVFESKGRSEKPKPGEIREWKKQAKMIRSVQGQRVKSQIVSIAYLNSTKNWEVLWVDPPAEGNLVVGPEMFLRFYYSEVFALFASVTPPLVDPQGLFTIIPGTGDIVGLHRDVLDALIQPRDGQEIKWPGRGYFIAELLLGFAGGDIANWPYWSNDGVGRLASFAQDHLHSWPLDGKETDGLTIFPDGIMVFRPAKSRRKFVGPRVVPKLPTTETMKTTPTAAIGTIGKPERVTQNRVIALFRDELGYRFLGDRSDRDNSNIEEDLLTAWLTKCKYTPEQISRAIYLLRTEATNPNRNLYENNKAVYSLLRYGVQLKTAAGELTETVKLINWRQPELNDFVIVEEVTLRGDNERRPDLVLYVNGLAVAVIELKNASTDVGVAIGQLLSNQDKLFHEWFFSTVQIVFAGNDSEGLRYGTIGTERKYFLQWKEEEADNTRFKLDKYLLKMCRKDRLIELLHDFVLFDGGIKKLPRVHQYFGLKAAQARVRAYIGGIIWHTQGSGKSIVMVLLAKWILENLPKARVLILTDRDELDKQIERVFTEAGEAIYRTSSGHDLMAQLGQAKPRLLCSLVHKFGKRGVKDFDAFIEELTKQPAQAVGELFVFVDECHRTQSGKLHKTMKALLPGAVFIGFTGTPLLKQDKQTSLEVFGGYIHTYKFGEAVEDEVVLDLVYEARDIEQSLGSQDKIDAWFEAKTKGLNDWQKAALREQWGTMQKVLSSRSRMERVVNDIVFDFSVKPRLSSQRGNAMLVASSIYEAAKYFELFQKTVFKGKCAVITSYNPQAQDVTKEDTGANTETEKQFLYNTYNALLKDVTAKPNKTKTESYEDDAKELFKTQPANMKLLVVVDKLLTGFDAPPCSYLYIDKSMQDHGLFQAICRTNRLDGEDKTFGYIVDYKDLFQKLVNDKGTGALQVYTSELDHTAEGTSPEVLMQDRLKKGSERLDQALEAMALLCEPVQPPKADLQHIHYFCGNTEMPDDLKAHEAQRVALYKGTAALVRAYANIADDLSKAGYTEARIARIKQSLDRYLKLREIIRKASDETIDLKAYEADMRHLIDTYIEAKEPRQISDFGEMGLLELIVKSGMADAISSLPDGIKSSRDAVAETISNNVRSKILKEHLNDPAFYDKMSALLKEILEDLRAKRIDYEEFLRRMAEVAKQVQAGQVDDTPESLDTPGKRAIYNQLEREMVAEPGSSMSEPPGAYMGVPPGSRLDLALRIDAAIRSRRPDGWRGALPKEREMKRIIHDVVNDAGMVERLFLIITAQREY